MVLDAGENVPCCSAKAGPFLRGHDPGVARAAERDHGEMNYLYIPEEWDLIQDDITGAAVASRWSTRSTRTRCICAYAGSGG